jgi:hypothetical protein
MFKECLPGWERSDTMLSLPTLIRLAARSAESKADDGAGLIVIPYKNACARNFGGHDGRPQSVDFASIWVGKRNILASVFAHGPGVPNNDRPAVTVILQNPSARVGCVDRAIACNCRSREQERQSGEAECR